MNKKGITIAWEWMMWLTLAVAVFMMLFFLVRRYAGDVVPS
jgi:hypothetical protein